jgi:nicotinamide mononucleotide transporter
MILAFASLLFFAALLLGAYGIGFQLPTTPMEAWAFIAGVVAVYYATLEKPISWPIGLVNVTLYGIVFFQQKLYANMALQGFYFVTGVMGWVSWLQNRPEKALPIRRGWRFALAAVALSLALSWPAAEFLISLGGAASYWDGLTTMVSLAAQWMLVRKRIENWWLWLGVNVISIALYLSIGLWLTALLFFVYMLLCVKGLSEWRAKLPA